MFPYVVYTEFIHTEVMSDLALVTFHTMGNTMEAGLSGEHLCPHPINYLTA